MNKKYFFCVFLFVLSSAVFSKEIFVVKFLVSEVSVCNSEIDMNSCTFIDRDELPDPDRKKIKVLDINNQGMVKVKLKRKVAYIHQTELRLNLRRKVTKACSMKYEKKSTVETHSYGTMGLMDDCYE